MRFEKAGGIPADALISVTALVQNPRRQHHAARRRKSAGSMRESSVSPLCENGRRYVELLQRTLIGMTFRDRPLGPWFGDVYREEARAGGQDWPSLARSMVGLRRMENVRSLVEQILLDKVEGDLVETGVWRGGVTIFMRGLLAAYDVQDRKVWAADSFRGLPPPDAVAYPADQGDIHSTFPELAVSLETVKQGFRDFGLLDDRVVFLEGWFKDTLPSAPIEAISLLRLDGDMYGSTMDVLSNLYGKVKPGGFVIIDDYFLAPCRQAVTDFRESNGIESPIIDIDGMGAYWRR